MAENKTQTEPKKEEVKAAPKTTEEKAKPTEVKKKEEKTKVPTVASVIVKVMEKGVKSKEECVTKVMKMFEKKGITHNIKGNEIKKEAVLRHFNNIEKALGTRKGWWAEYTVVEKEDFRQWVKKTPATA